MNEFLQNFVKQDEFKCSFNFGTKKQTVTTTVTFSLV